MSENHLLEPKVSILSRKGLNLDSDEKLHMTKKLDILASKIDQRPSQLLRDKSLAGEFKRTNDDIEPRSKKLVQYKTIISILQKIKHERSKADIKLLSHFMCEKYAFFKKLREDSDNEKLEACLKVLNYEQYDIGSNIINEGEVGDKLYIILTGTVTIYKNKFVKEEMTMKKFMQYLRDIKYNEKNELKLKRVEDANADNTIALVKIFDYDPSKCIQGLNYTKIFTVEIEEFLTEKSEGDFGEVALAQRINRTATVRATTYCDIASVDRANYNLVIRELEEKKFNGRIESLRKCYPIISSWHKQTIIKLMTFFTKVKVCEGENVYEQYEDSHHIYFIIKGTFEISTCISLSNSSHMLDYIVNSKASMLNYFRNGQSISNADFKLLKENAGI
jgi:CRP-like cAMP-binding protein